MKTTRLVALGAIATVTALLSVSTAPAAEFRAASGPGPLVDTPDGKSVAEVFALDPGLVSGLMAVPLETPVRITDWPVAPGERRNIVVARHEIYAPGARMLRVEGPLTIEVPRSRRIALWGTVEDSEMRVSLTADPDTLEIEGLTLHPEGLFEVREASVLGASRRGRHLVAKRGALNKESDVAATYQCGQELLSASAWTSTRETKRASNEGPVPNITSLHTVTVAVDTDNEVMQLKFGDNTTTAANYMTSLFAGMNVIYERDLKVRLLQGTTFYRVSSMADPYPSTTGPSADNAKLNEFTNYWAANYGGITRALAMMISGKQSGDFSASGIAWVNVLCSTGSGYSFSQVFKFAGSTATNDLLVVAHELGHNFGSPHTHCYTPPIDQCYNTQAGCYAGAKSCPAPQTINGVANVTGTLMSYCHLSGIGGCTSSLVYHPTSVALLDPLITSKVGICVFPALAVTAINPNNGSTAGGTAVTISGTDFQAGATVSIGGVAATSVIVVNATTITAVTGAHATGAVNVSVTNPGGGGTATLTNGYFYTPPLASTPFYTISPCRIFDTRNPNGPLGGPALTAQGTRTFTLTGTCGVPATAKVLSVNVAAIGTSGAGEIRIYPGNGIQPGTTTVLFGANQTRANNALLWLATDGTGTVKVYNNTGAAVNFILDVNGYFE